MFDKAQGTASHRAGADVIITASAPNEVDYEGEIGMVIGAPTENVSVEDAYSVVAGLVAINDVSARDVQAVGKPLEAVAKANNFCDIQTPRAVHGDPR